jgi:hypothetical protein
VKWWFFPTFTYKYDAFNQTFDKDKVRYSIMEPTHDTTEEWERGSSRAWMVEYTVEVDEDSNRHLSLIHADDVTEIHHMLLRELRKAYHDSTRVDVTIHRMEPVTTNTDALYFEGIYAP